MSTPVGEMIIENHDEENEENNQVVLVIDSEEGLREYRWDCYDIKGNMQKRVGYTSGMKIWNSGSVGKGDTMGILTTKEKATLRAYLKTLSIEHEDFKEVE